MKIRKHRTDKKEDFKPAAQALSKKRIERSLKVHEQAKIDLSHSFGTFDFLLVEKSKLCSVSSLSKQRPNSRDRLKRALQPKELSVNQAKRLKESWVVLMLKNQVTLKKVGEVNMSNIGGKSVNFKTTKESFYGWSI